MVATTLLDQLGTDINWDGDIGIITRDTTSGYIDLTSLVSLVKGPVTNYVYVYQVITITPTSTYLGIINAAIQNCNYEVINDYSLVDGNNNPILSVIADNITTTSSLTLTLNLVAAAYTTPSYTVKLLGSTGNDITSQFTINIGVVNQEVILQQPITITALSSQNIVGNINILTSNFQYGAYMINAINNYTYISDTLTNTPVTVNLYIKNAIAKTLTYTLQIVDTQAYTIVDLLTISGLENLDKALLRRLNTPQTYIGRFIGSIDGLRTVDFNYGNSLYNILSEPQSAANFTDIQNSIRNALLADLRVSTVDVSLTSPAPSNGQLLININYAISGTNSTKNLVIGFNGNSFVTVS